jgi:hypothetical protein
MIGLGRIEATRALERLSLRRRQVGLLQDGAQAPLQRLIV